MNKFYIYYFLLSIATFASCTNSEECAADIAVTALTAGETVLTGNIVKIRCVIQNLERTTESCLFSDPGTATVSQGYNASYSKDPNDYELTSEPVTVSMEDYVYEKGQEDFMDMIIDKGTGYYMMTVETNSPIDNNSRNNIKDVIVHIY